MIVFSYTYLSLGLINISFVAVSTCHFVDSLVLQIFSSFFQQMKYWWFLCVRWIIFYYCVSQVLFQFCWFYFHDWYIGFFWSCAAFNIIISYCGSRYLLVFVMLSSESLYAFWVEWSCTSTRGICWFSEIPMMNLIFGNLRFRWLKNLFISIFPCFQITIMLSTYHSLG